MANERGFVCSHVSYLGFAGDKDWELPDKILGGDWPFITAKSPDFRGSRDAPGSKGEYADIALHAGLICINAPGGKNRAVQHAVMNNLLMELEALGYLTNQVEPLLGEFLLSQGTRFYALREKMVVGNRGDILGHLRNLE